MARAKRHYIPGHIWHITHRCHKNEFLLKFSHDKRRWLQWLFKAKQDYGLVILNYTVTSNHIHLIVADDNGREAIPRSLQLVAGRTAQEYNKRKNRTGAYWKDRYHATAIESGNHLLRCLVYVDMNMPRTGMISHPSKWAYGGYREIQTPRRKNRLIAYNRLSELAGFNRYEEFKAAHQEWVEAAIINGTNVRDGKWTQSIAVGSQNYVENVKEVLGIQAKGRKVVGETKTFQLREPLVAYNADFSIKKNDIGPQNLYFWQKN